MGIRRKVMARKILYYLKQLFPHSCFRKYELSDKIVYIAIWKEWFGRKYDFDDCITAHKQYSLNDISNEEIDKAISIFKLASGCHYDV